MLILPEHDRPITLRTIGKGHRYQVDGVDCNACANCRKGKPCIGLPSVTTITGKYGDGDLYGAGYRAALNAVFGAYTSRDKDQVEEDSWFSDFFRTTDGRGSPGDILRYRQEVEEMPTPGEVARKFGTGVHATLEEWLKAKQRGEIPFLEGDYIAPARPIVEWLDRHECEVMDVEVKIYHPTLLYGGTVDCIARRGDVPLILDWKSGRAIYTDAAAQVAGYALAYEAMTGERVNEAWVLRSGKNGFEAQRVKDLEIAKWLFVNLHSVRENWDKISWEDGT